jgi:type II secretory pathway predicted ATPase ExeA
MDVARIIVEGERYQMAMEWLEECLLEAGTGHEATTGLLFGIPGVGKSTALRRFMKKYGKPLETREGTKRTVIRVVTPSNPNLGTLFEAMLDALGAGAVLGGKNADKKTAVVTQLKRQGVKMVMFDEFTHVIEDKSQKFAKNVAREIKEMLSEGRCQCVLAGTPELRHLHAIYSQFRRRSGGDFCIQPFDPADEDDLEEWRDTMEAIDVSLPIGASTALHSRQRSLDLLVASHGVMDNVMKLLFRATALAYDEGADAISDQHLADAFQRMRRGDTNTANPFGRPTRRHAKPTTFRLEEDELDDSWTNLRTNPKGKKKGGDTDATAA